ncbi:unnamed protein product [Lota lota]
MSRGVPSCERGLPSGIHDMGPEQGQGGDGQRGGTLSAQMYGNVLKSPGGNPEVIPPYENPLPYEGSATEGALYPELPTPMEPLENITVLNTRLEEHGPPADYCILLNPMNEMLGTQGGVAGEIRTLAGSNFQADAVTRVQGNIEHPQVGKTFEKGPSASKAEGESNKEDKDPFPLVEKEKYLALDQEGKAKLREKQDVWKGRNKGAKDDGNDWRVELNRTNQPEAPVHRGTVIPQWTGGTLTSYPNGATNPQRKRCIVRPQKRLNRNTRSATSGVHGFRSPPLPREGVVMLGLGVTRTIYTAGARKKWMQRQQQEALRLTPWF